MDVSIAGAQRWHPATDLPISKYQALGNSYLILDPRRIDRSAFEDATAFDEQGFPTPSLVRALCSISAGIGSNGLLFGPLKASKSKALCRFRIVNSDGTIAGYSGNGSRIFAKYLLDLGDARRGISAWFEIDEDGLKSESQNLVQVRFLEGVDGRIEVTSPQVPRFGADAVGGRQGGLSIFRGGTCCVPALADIGAKITHVQSAWSKSILVNLGNPHCVTIVDDRTHLPQDANFSEYHSALRRISFHDAAGRGVFEHGINLQWVYPESRTRLRLMIYERGEGPTLASGSSASAAACCAYVNKLVESAVDVVMPGGSLNVFVAGSPDTPGAVTISGFANRIMQGHFNRTKSLE